MTRHDRAPTAPYSEPLLPQLDIQNPYYTDLHHSLRAYVRDYVESSIEPYAHDWEAAGQVPESVRRRHCELGFGIVHPLTTPEDAAGLSLPNNVPREKWDTWCGLIVADELTRIGYVGVVWGLGGGNAIGCPPIARFGTAEQRQRWLPGVAAGDIRFCLGITEPDAGSDVANISTTAKRKGDHYIVNGAKKWITNGIWADYCTAAVRTGGPGKAGISLLVIPLAAPGVTRRWMYNSGVHASGSTFIELDEVRVPVDHLIGEENKGFLLIMSSMSTGSCICALPYCFSAETLRLSLSGTGLAQGRFLLSDCSRSVGQGSSACAERSLSVEPVRRSDPGSIPEQIRDCSAKLPAKLTTL